MSRGIERLWDGLLDSLALAAAVLLGMVAMTVVYDVAARVFFNSPTNWAVDFSEYALVYITFLPAAWALREHAHVRIDLFVSRLTPRTRVFFWALTSVVAAAAVVVIAWQGIAITWDAYVQGHVALKPWQVRRWIQLVPIPLGSLLLLGELLRQALRAVHALGQPDAVVADLDQAGSVL